MSQSDLERGFAEALEMAVKAIYAAQARARGYRLEASTFVAEIRALKPSPLPMDDAGSAKCKACGGRGEVWGKQSTCWISCHDCGGSGKER
jgi:hypothetical protein